MARRSKKSNNQNQDVVLVTKHGYDELVRELEERKQLRDDIAREIEEARDLGDLSENASYQEAMERKDLNERRISELEDLISRIQIVEEDKSNSNVITIGRSVELKNLNDSSTKVVHLVGATEADPLKSKISIDSPLGKVLLNSKVGDTVEVNVPVGIVRYQVLKLVD